MCLLIKELEERQAHWLRQKMYAVWQELDEVTRTYLIIRACDIVRFGERVAKLTYPQPVIGGMSAEQVAQLIDVLVTALREATVEKGRLAGERRHKSIEEHVRSEVATLDRDIVTELLPRKLTETEIQRLKAACWRELSGCEPAVEMVRVIEKFVEFCELLARPENHIKVPSRRYVEKSVNTRQESDMTNEMARVLTGLPKYTAYAKLLYETDGGQIVWKGKIQTLQLKGEVAEEEAKARRAAIEQNSMQYLESRTLIEEEIRQRQERWRSRVIEEPPRTQSAVVNGRQAPYEAGDIAVDEPPPPTQSPPGGEADEPPSSHL